MNHTEVFLKFKIHRCELERRIQAVHEHRDDLRHLVNLPMNPRTLRRLNQRYLNPSENAGRRLELLNKIKRGFYSENEIVESVADRILIRIWDHEL